MSTERRPIVSVVIPTYNRARRLPVAIDSALAQDCGLIEVIVIDDGSSDDTRAMVARRYGSDPRVKYVHRANGGAAAARNEGLKRCRGDYIAFLDSDDRWLAGKLQLQLACLRSVPEAGMISTDMEAIDLDERVLHKNYLRMKYHGYRRFPTYLDVYQAEHSLAAAGRQVTIYSGEIYSAMVLGNLVHTSTVLVRRDWVERIGSFREDFRRGGEDYHFHLRVCREGPVAFVDAVTIQYQVGAPDAMTRPEYQLDMNYAYIATLDEALARDRGRISIPEKVIAECRAEAYASAARAALDAGLAQSARTMYLKSLRLRPLGLSSLQFFIVAALPRAVRAFLFKTVRRTRTVVKSWKPSLRILSSWIHVISAWL